MPPLLLDALGKHLRTAHRPNLTDIRRRLSALAARHGLRTPSRATLYNTLPHVVGTESSAGSLPAPVREALYNVTPDGRVPGRQVAFYCFNYGSLAAISFAAGLPWLDLYQSGLMRGWRPRSRGLLLAALRARGQR